MTRTKVIQWVAVIAFLAVATCLGISIWERVMGSKEKPVSVEPVLQLSLISEKDTSQVGQALGGQITLSNAGLSPIEIRYNSDPKQYLDFQINDEHGRKIEPYIKYGHLFSPMFQREIFTIRPGEAYSSSVSLLATVEEEDKPLGPGTYQIRAVYDYESLHAESNVVAVKITP